MDKELHRISVTAIIYNKLDEDSVDYKWITAKEAESYDLIEGIADEIKMVDDLLKIKI